MQVYSWLGNEYLALVDINAHISLELSVYFVDSYSERVLTMQTH